MRTGYERLREGLAPPAPASPSAGLPEGESRRSAYVSESDDAEIMDAAASATDDWAVGRDRAHVSTATEKTGGYSTFFLHYDRRSRQGYDAAAELPQLATLGLTVLEAPGRTTSGCSAPTFRWAPWGPTRPSRAGTANAGGRSHSLRR